MVTMTTTVVCLLLCLTVVVWGRNSKRPHIVFILADDLGWDDVGFHGSEIATPHIDELAHKGVMLNNYYVSPICTPTRGALMTGRYPIHIGLQHYVIAAPQPYGLPLNVTTMPQYLQKLGYSTHIVGKWHLGFFAKEYTPTFRGFDSHFGYWVGLEDYFDHTAYDGGDWGLDFCRNLELVTDAREQYSTELFSAEAEKIIRNHNSSQPLFLYVAHQAVHAGNIVGDPLQAPQRYIDRFPHIKDVNRRIFAGMTAALDDSVGNITRALSDAGLLDNTIIVFSTDNGGPANGYDRNAACNWPLRGTKNTLWEGGIRGTGFVYSPLLKKQGYASDKLFHVTDWLPTLYHAVGGDHSDLPNIDGHDGWEMLSTDGAGVRDELLINIDPIGNSSAIRVGEYKLITGDISGGRNDNWYPPPGISGNFRTVENTELHKDKFSDITNNLFYQKNDAASFKVECGKKPFNATTNCQPMQQPCLFHIPTDPCEYNNIAAQKPTLVKALLLKLGQYTATAVPPGNKPADPKANPQYHGGAWVPWIDLKHH